MNEKLIKELLNERKKLYPNGCPIQPRGCNMSMSHLTHFFRYYAYDHVIEMYKNADYKVGLDDAHRDIEEFIKSFLTG